jgi:excisionase family DNA binding protein
VACEVITVPEAARRVGRHPEPIRRWIRCGRLRSVRVGTRHLVHEDDVLSLAGVATLGLPGAWITGDDGTAMPDWERLVRDARVRH